MANTKSAQIQSSSSQSLSITNANQTGLGFTSTFSWSSWVKRSTISAWQMFLAKRGASGGYYIVYFDSNNKFGVDYTDSSGSTNSTSERTTNAITTTDWVMLTATCDASTKTIKFYVNSSLVASTNLASRATSIATNSYDVSIGQYNSGNYYDGLIDETSIWNKVLTAEEISDLYNNGYGQELAGNESGLVAYYKYEDDFTDSTSNGNDLTNNNSATFSSDVPDTFPSSWLSSQEIQIDYTKVSGSANLTDFPVLLTADSLTTDIFDNVNVGTKSIDLEDTDTNYLSITDASQTGLDLNGDFTFELWVNFESLPGSGENRYLIVKDDASGRQYQMQLQYQDASNTKLSFFAFQTASVLYENNLTFNPTPGEWYHITLTFDISGGLTDMVEWFIDGVSQGNGTGSRDNISSIQNTSAVFCIGERTPDTNGTMDGKIKNVRIWSDIRTDAEIVKGMNYQVLDDYAGCVSEWRFDDAITDSVGSNDLTWNYDSTYTTPTYSTDIPTLKPSDLRFTTDSAGTTQIPFEIVDFTPGSPNTAEIHVKVPSVSYTANTSIYCWYNNSSASALALDDTYGSEAVWSDYEAVWHLNEASGDRYDSTANANTLTDNNTVGSATGKIGTGADFEESNSEKLTINDNDLSAGFPGKASTGSSGDFTFQYWVNFEQLPETLGENMGIFNKFGAAPNRSYQMQALTSGVWNYTVNDGASDNDGFTHTNGASAGTPMMVHWTFDASASGHNLYEDGSVVDTDSKSVTSLGLVSTPFTIGEGPTAGDYFDGILDEFRVRTEILTTDWIATEYNNQNSPSTFATAVSPVTDTSNAIFFANNF